MRICMQVLLCTVHARIYGVGWLGIREEDFCEEGCGGTAGAGHAEIFVRVKELWRRVPGSYCDWDGDRPLPAGGAGIWSDARVPGGVGEARRTQHFVDYEVEPDCARLRFVQENRGTIGDFAEYYDHDAAASAGTAAGAASATAGFTVGGGEAAAGSGTGRGRVGLSADTGNDGSRWGTGRTGRRREKSWGAMVLF